ncbi:CBS domain-containing protein [Promicromonospora alba]|uniref:CBS domain-containing protein n=1 Tax=Promicromonospora alba TaxID=1616110 RepID=A0ABV9HG48_9MICO
MVQTVADVMTAAPTSVDVTDTIEAAARAMASEDVGALIVRSESRIVGIITDRDIVVRGLAEGRDLAVERDPSSALADISEEPPNR